MIPLFRKLDWLFQRRRKEAELREELDFHLSVEASVHEEAGLAHDKAKAAARRELGNWDSCPGRYALHLGLVLPGPTCAGPALCLPSHEIQLAFHPARDAHSGLGNRREYRDLQLPGRHPGSYAAGCRSAIFDRVEVAHRTHRDSVMHGMSTGASSDTYDDPQAGTIGGIFPYPAFELVQKQNGDSLFSSVFAFESAFADSLDVSIKGEPGCNLGFCLGGIFFGTWCFSGGRPSHSSRDDRTSAPTVAVVSYSMSQARFGGPANAIGQPILVDNVPFTVVGVTPQGFFGVDPRYNPSIYLPFRTNLLLGAANPFGLRPNDYLAANFYWVQMMARLRPGVSAQQAQAALVEPFHQWVSTTATTDIERANLPQLLVNPAATGLDSCAATIRSRSTCCWDGCFDLASGMRQRRQSSSRACRRPASRNRPALEHWGKPISHHSPTLDRKPLLPLPQAEFLGCSSPSGHSLSHLATGQRPQRFLPAS